MKLYQFWCEEIDFVNGFHGLAYHGAGAGQGASSSNLFSFKSV